MARRGEIGDVKRVLGCGDKNSYTPISCPQDLSSGYVAVAETKSPRGRGISSSPSWVGNRGCLHRCTESPGRRSFCVSYWDTGTGASPDGDGTLSERDELNELRRAATELAKKLRDGLIRDANHYQQQEAASQQILSS